MTSWGRVSDYVYLIKATGVPAYERRLLFWLKEQGYPQLESLRKELARGDRKGSADSSSEKGKKAGGSLSSGEADGGW
jgi:hypothetical protein